MPVEVSASGHKFLKANSPQKESYSFTRTYKLVLL
jgi:hypothetical protein